MRELPAEPELLVLWNVPSPVVDDDIKGALVILDSTSLMSVGCVVAIEEVTCENGVVTVCAVSKSPSLSPPKNLVVESEVIVGAATVTWLMA